MIDPNIPTLLGNHDQMQSCGDMLHAAREGGTARGAIRQALASLNTAHAAAAEPYVWVTREEFEAQPSPLTCAPLAPPSKPSAAATATRIVDEMNRIADLRAARPKQAKIVWRLADGILTPSWDDPSEP